MAKQRKKEQKKSLLADFYAKRVGNLDSWEENETKPEKTYYLIVCEGERTEPNYFESLKLDLPRHMVETIEVLGVGDNTLRVVKKAVEKKLIRKENPILPDYDEVWAVYDKDDFPSSHFNEADSFAKREGIHCGWSNEAFELWYLLHFQYLEAAISRKEYFQKLSSIIKEIKGPKASYSKNDMNMYKLLQEYGDESLAIKYAEKLEVMHEENTPSDSKPCTKIYHLIRKLREK